MKSQIQQLKRILGIPVFFLLVFSNTAFSPQANTTSLKQYNAIADKPKKLDELINQAKIA